MKKLVFITLIIVFSMTMIGCLNRVDRFTIPLVEDSFSYNGEDDIYLYGKLIRKLEISFADTDETTIETSSYEKNLFGDFSYEEIKVYSITFYIWFDDTEEYCEVDFLGIANPGRNNAYRLNVIIPGIDEGVDYDTIHNDTFDVVLDFDQYEENKETLYKIQLQIINDYTEDATHSYDIYLDLTTNS